jgi:hypothetical protein
MDNSHCSASTRGHHRERYPRDPGYQQRAIVQSGNGSGALSQEQAARVTHAAGAALGITSTATDFAAPPTNGSSRSCPNSPIWTCERTPDSTRCSDSARSVS